MKYKFINLNIMCAGDTTHEQAEKLELQLKSFVEALGLSGSISFDVSDDVGVQKK